MKLLTSIIAISTLLASQLLFAHGDHLDEPISESAARAIALNVTSKLSTQDAGLGFGQLASSWGAIQANNVVIYKKGNGYYIVAAKNEDEKSTLYILISEGGEVYDANFSGNFIGIN